ncbi:MAG: hypothetical protein EP348_10375 [Alphaproteobacteria bacterium]|nr:MAG: hypothetical protein EP348_10375 [Alphaproteobacteria bacterium]
MAWVYDKLVENDTDISGQFAYLFYKSEKRKFAEKLKTSGKSDDEIRAQLKAYQEGVVGDSDAIAAFKASGDIALKKYLSEVQSNTLNTARNEFLAEIQRIGTDINNLNRLVGAERGIVRRFASWLLIGVRAWISTALIGLILFIIALLFVSDHTKEGVMDEALDGFAKFIECHKSTPPAGCQ